MLIAGYWFVWYGGMVRMVVGKADFGEETRHPGGVTLVLLADDEEASLPLIELKLYFESNVCLTFPKISVFEVGRELFPREMTTTTTSSSRRAANLRNDAETLQHPERIMPGNRTRGNNPPEGEPEAKKARVKGEEVVDLSPEALAAAALQSPDKEADTTLRMATPAVTTDDASKTAAAIASVGGPLDEKQQAEINAALERVKEETLKDTPAISTIVTEGLWENDPRKVEECLTELANLSFGIPNAGPNRVTISLTGGLLAIVKAMTKHANDAGVQAAGGRALQNLSLDQNNKGGIATSGGIEVLVAAMKKFPNDSAVQMGGCGTFQNLVWGNDQNRLRLLGAGAIPEIIAAMRKHAKVSELQEWACGSLFLLSVGEREVKDAILENGGLSAIAKSIEDHKDDGAIREKGRNALARLLFP